MPIANQSVCWIFASAAVVLLMAVFPPVADATFPGANGRIGLLYEFDGTYRDIGTVRPDGTGLRVLTTLGSDEEYADELDWSADGRRLIYTQVSLFGRIDRTPFVLMAHDGSREREIALSGL